MKSILVVLALAAVASAFIISGDSALDAFKFESWKTKYNKKYENPDAEDHAFQNFRNTIVRVAAKQAKSEARGYDTKWGTTKFADLSPQEFKSMYLTYKRPAIAPTRKVGQADYNAAPDSFDWRDKNAVTDVKDQGQCGSCWAFSATENIESMWFLAGYELPTLSPQQIVDCDKVDQGCNGGNTETAFDYVKQAGGLESDNDYPYTGYDGTCNFNKADVVATGLTGYEYATPMCNDSCTHQDEKLLVANLYAQGPLAICVDASDWSDYESGMYSGDCQSDANSLDHCVQLVAYDTTDQYYWVRNSWNTDWGWNGYIQLAMGQNTCGLADDANYAVFPKKPVY